MGDEAMSLKLKVMGRNNMARALADSPMRCPVIDCNGRLTVQAERFGGSKDVPLFHVGCNAEPMPVWDKSDLVYLRGQPVKIVVREGPIAEAGNKIAQAALDIQRAIDE